MAKKKEFTLTFTKVGEMINISQTDSGFSSIELIGLLTLAISHLTKRLNEKSKQEDVK